MNIRVNLTAKRVRLKPVMTVEAKVLQEASEDSEALYWATGSDYGMALIERYSRGEVALHELAMGIKVCQARTPTHEAIIAKVAKSAELVSESDIAQLLSISKYPKQLADYLLAKRPELDSVIEHWLPRRFNSQ